jgi:hypothetical protein
MHVWALCSIELMVDVHVIYGHKPLIMYFHPAQRVYTIIEETYCGLALSFCVHRPC